MYTTFQWTFVLGNTGMASKHMKSWLITSVIRDIKITMKYHSMCSGIAGKRDLPNADKSVVKDEKVAGWELWRCAATVDQFKTSSKPHE